MLLRTMTIPEIRREVLKDAPSILKKAAFVARKTVKNLKLAKNKTACRVIEFKSALYNNWILGFKLGRQNSEAFLMSYFYNRSGLHAYGIFGDSDYLLHFDDHFFKRYNERLKLGLQTRLEAMKAFAGGQFFYSLHRRKGKYRGNTKIFIITENGLILGDQDDATGMINARTFLPLYMLNRKQFAFIRYGIQQLLTQIEHSLRPVVTIKV